MKRLFALLQRLLRRRRRAPAAPPPAGGAGPGNAFDREPHRPLVPVLSGGAEVPVPAPPADDDE